MTEKKKLKLVTDEQAEIDARKREARVFELRIQGFTFEQIASEVGYQGASGAWQAYKRVKETLIFESIEEARQLELMRLDEMMFALWGRAIGGDLPAASCVLKIMDRRAKLLGLDKPERIEVNKWDFDDADLDAEVQPPNTKFSCVIFTARLEHCPLQLISEPQPVTPWMYLQV